MVHVELMPADTVLHPLCSSSDTVSLGPLAETEQTAYTGDGQHGGIQPVVSQGDFSLF